MITFTELLINVGSAIHVVSAPTWMIIGLVIGTIWLFARGNNNPNSPVSWEDLVVDDQTNRTSPYKLGYMIGVVVSTWVIIQYAVELKLGIELFATYLTYLVGGAGWMAMVQGKQVAPLPNGVQKDNTQQLNG